MYLLAETVTATSNWDMIANMSAVAVAIGLLVWIITQRDPKIAEDHRQELLKQSELHRSERTEDAKQNRQLLDQITSKFDCSMKECSTTLKELSDNNRSVLVEFKKVNG